MAFDKETRKIRDLSEEAARELAEEVNSMKYEKSRKKKAESLRRGLKANVSICGAISKETGRICSRPPVEGATRCAAHGGCSTGARTPEGKEKALANLNPRANFVTGMYGQFVMSAEEDTFYETMMNHYIDELDLDPANILILDRALRNFILNQRKERVEAEEILNEIQFDIDYDSKFLKHMQALGLDRKFQLSVSNKENNSGGSGIAMLFMNDGDE
jgi:hypothetical protein